MIASRSCHRFIRENTQLEMDFDFDFLEVGVDDWERSDKNRALNAIPKSAKLFCDK